MSKVGFIYSPVFLKHATPLGHPESKERLRAITAGLEAAPFWNDIIKIEPSKADFDDIARVHTNGYIEDVKNFGSGHLDADTYFSTHSLEAALYAAGAVTEAVRRCKSGEITHAFCAVRPPGHHAETDRAMGFCIFNNIAIGARYAQKSGYKKVFIIDFDVHHGNGTQHTFYEDDTVFYFSTHQYPHYPGTGGSDESGRGRGEGYTYNLPMSSGSGYKEFFSAYCEVLPGLVRRFGPDIVLVSAGYDIHASDPLAGLRVSDEGIRSIVSCILSSPAGPEPVPIIFVLEGGYDLEALASSVRITIEEMLKA
ncbi:MAG: histone deacetylase [Nitrospirae bacterium]|nr:histone deacetylase [Nitrospirota bacterium]